VKRISPGEADRLSALVLAALEKKLSRERIRHSTAVARLTGELCPRRGIEAARGRLAGIGHDVAREMSAAETLAYVGCFGLRSTAFERERPALLHGRVGSDILRREYGLRDGEILAAVSEHVLGRPGMGPLSQMLYAADFLEPGRGFLPEDERLALLALGLADMVVRVSEKIFRFLEAEGKPIAPISKRMYVYFKRRRRSGRQ